MTKKYLLYIDILGFYNLAQEIASVSGFTADHVRQHILSEPFRRTITENNDDFYYSLPGTDHYFIIVNERSTLYQILNMITNIKISHEKFGLIPIEAGIDVIDVADDFMIDIKNTDEFHQIP